jgi:hypothetical protein
MRVHYDGNLLRDLDELEVHLGFVPQKHIEPEKQSLASLIKDSVFGVFRRIRGGLNPIKE